MATYGFIGLGNMASAILAGMKKSGKYDMGAVLGYDPVDTKAQECGVRPSSSVGELGFNADVIVLAIKPQVLPQVLPELQSRRPNALVISIAAGKTLAYLEDALGLDAPIIRAMPNINAKVGAATTAICANKNASKEQKDTAKNLLTTIGTVTELPEKQFSVFTAIASSSPAFTYMYIDSLARAAVEAGMPKSQALFIAASSVLGSAKLVMETDEHPYVLVDSVCSPGGITIEGVLSLQASGFESAVHKAVEAVIAKDKTL